MADGGARPRVMLRLQRGDSSGDLIAMPLIKGFDWPNGDAMRTFTGKSHDRIGFAQSLQGNRYQQQRLALDIDDPLVCGNPGIGGTADVDEQHHRHVAPGRPASLIQRLCHRRSRAEIRIALHPGFEVDLLAFELLAQPHAVRPQHFKAALHRQQHRAVGGKRALDPFLRPLCRRHQAHGHAGIAVGGNPPIPFRVVQLPIAGGCSLSPLPCPDSRRVVGQQDFLWLARRGNEPGFGQLRQGIGEFFGGRAVVAVSRPLQADRVFRLLVRLGCLHHPCAGPGVVFIFRSFAHLRAPASRALRGGRGSVPRSASAPVGPIQASRGGWRVKLAGPQIPEKLPPLPKRSRRVPAHFGGKRPCLPDVAARGSRGRKSGHIRQQRADKLFQRTPVRGKCLQRGPARQQRSAARFQGGARARQHADKRLVRRLRLQHGEDRPLQFVFQHVDECRAAAACAHGLLQRKHAVPFKRLVRRHFRQACRQPDAGAVSGRYGRAGARAFAPAKNPGEKARRRRRLRYADRIAGAECRGHQHIEALHEVPQYGCRRVAIRRPVPAPQFTGIDGRMPGGIRDDVFGFRHLRSACPAG